MKAYKLSRLRHRDPYSVTGMSLEADPLREQSNALLLSQGTMERMVSSSQPQEARRLEKEKEADATS